MTLRIGTIIIHDKSGYGLIFDWSNEIIRLTEEQVCNLSSFVKDELEKDKIYDDTIRGRTL